MEKFTALIAGLLFGAGVTISGMVNPMKVLNFMDLAGTWDPSLIFVMGAGLMVTLLGYRLVFRRTAPLFARSFLVPASDVLDAKLLGGAVLFGLGWGLSGFCPGPAVASLVFGYPQSFMFVIAMAIGMTLTRMAYRRMMPV